MRRFSVLLLVFLGLVVLASGVLELLRGAQILTFSANMLGPLLIIILGFWIIACAIECRRMLGGSV